jgi:NADP-dependent 3-hydroxy acid dehydrogenase YdfG
MRSSPVVLITGATSGIGAATARALSADHAVVLVGRRTERLAALVQEVVAQGGTAWGITADLTGEGVPRGVVEEALTRAGRLDAVVNNAGCFETAGIGAITPEHLDRLWRLNVLAPILLTQAALPHLRGSRGGTVVQISSHVAEVAFSGCGGYAATKAALEAWSRSLREELRGTGVRVAIVAPGATDTEVWPDGAAWDRTRMCRPEDIAQIIRTAITLPPSASLDRVVVTPPGGAL